MIRPTSLILMVLTAAAGGALFQIAFEVSELDGDLSQLNRDIRKDREAIHVLRAEWSFLNQPERLEELTRRHLDLLPVSGGQLAGSGAVPVRAQDQEPVTDPLIADTGAAAKPAVLQDTAPKVKPAAPRRTARLSSQTTNRADLVRSFDDVLREAIDTPGSGGAR